LILIFLAAEHTENTKNYPVEPGQYSLFGMMNSSVLSVNSVAKIKTREKGEYRRMYIMADANFMKM
jgi:hypothetical protein